MHVTDNETPIQTHIMGLAGVAVSASADTMAASSVGREVCVKESWGSLCWSNLDFTHIISDMVRMCR